MIDYTTPEGVRLRGILVDRANELSKRLEDVGLNDRDTSLTRGALGELRRLLSSPMAAIPLHSYNTPGGTHKW
jgi:hypothetical protein